MSKVLLAMAALFMSANALASQITMYENKAPLNTEPVERVIVRGDYVQMNTIPHPCASYPGFPDKVLGDVYSCSTNRTIIAQFFADEKVMSLPDVELANYLLNSSNMFHCETAMKPSLVKYNGQNVYWFSGPLVPGAPTK